MTGENSVTPGRRDGVQSGGGRLILGAALLAAVALVIWLVGRDGVPESVGPVIAPSIPDDSRPTIVATERVVSPLLLESEPPEATIASLGEAEPPPATIDQPVTRRDIDVVVVDEHDKPVVDALIEAYSITAPDFLALLRSIDPVPETWST